MPVIMPVSTLRSYTEVLDDVRPGSPVFLTKNGHGRLVLDGRDVAYALDVAQVETSGGTVGSNKQAKAAIRQIVRLGKSCRSHAAKRQQHEKREGDGTLGNSPHAKPHSVKQEIQKGTLSSYHII